MTHGVINPLSFANYHRYHHPHIDMFSPEPGVKVLSASKAAPVYGGGNFTIAAHSHSRSCMIRVVRGCLVQVSVELEEPGGIDARRLWAYRQVEDVGTHGAVRFVRDLDGDSYAAVTSQRLRAGDGVVMRRGALHTVGWSADAIWEVAVIGNVIAQHARRAYVPAGCAPTMRANLYQPMSPDRLAYLRQQHNRYRSLL